MLEVVQKSHTKYMKNHEFQTEMAQNAFKIYQKTSGNHEPVLKRVLLILMEFLKFKGQHGTFLCSGKKKMHP